MDVSWRGSGSLVIRTIVLYSEESARWGGLFYGVFNGMGSKDQRSFVGVGRVSAAGKNAPGLGRR